MIAEGTYVQGSRSDPIREHWTLSKTEDGRYIAEGNAMHTPETEILNYRIEMDAALHPSLVELHTIMDYPSYTCKLGRTTVRCILSFESERPAESVSQNASLKEPFDLFGFHSYGWILSSIVGRLSSGQKQATVHLFLPNEDRYPNAVAEVQRESPESITVAGKTFEAQRFHVTLVMSDEERSAATVWTSRSGLCLRVQSEGETDEGYRLAVNLVSYKQTEAFVPEMQR
jgi:hypothetical protein